SWFAAARSQSAFWPDQREHGTLRIEALHDPAAAGDLVRAVENLTAAALHARHGGFDSRDVEVIKPKRRGRLRCLGHDAAGLRAINRESLVDTHGPHVDRLSLGPTEQAGIEREGGFALARVQFAPVDTTGRPRGRRRLIARPFEEHESRAMRIAGNGETANAGDVFGAAM